MSQKFLDKFRSKLPTTQGNQILRRLVEKRNSGEIRTLDEFKNRLKELTTELLKERLKPTIKLFDAVPGRDISSTQFNDMLSHIEDDLEAAFIEAENLDEVIEAHHQLIQQVSLKTIRYSLNQLKAKVSFYEFISNNTAGFDDALHNTFTEAGKLSTSRADEAASLVFWDPRKGSSISEDEDAIIDIIGERLTAGGKELTYIIPKDIEWLANENSIRGEINVEFENSDLNNLLDNTLNTFWVVAILLNEINTSGVSCELRLALPGTRDVNFVEIEPATDAPLVLTDIGYYSASNERQSVSVADTIIQGKTRINFQKIAAKDLILRFRQDNFKEIQYVEQLAQSNFHKALTNETVPANTLDISSDLEEILSSDFVINDVFQAQDTTGSLKKYYQYLVGFDNIRLGHHLYDDRSVYASSKKVVSNPRALGLKVEETRPVQNISSSIITSSNYLYPNRETVEDNKIYHGAIEYWVVGESYNSSGFLIATDIFPILPYQAKRVYHERLIFTHKSSSSIVNNNQGSLVFYTTEDPLDILVYKNGILLEYSTDWTFVADGVDDKLTVENPDSGARMRRAVQITATVNPMDIYTVSYTPTVSNSLVIPSDDTLFTTVDLTGDHTVRMCKDNIVVLDKFRDSYEVAKAHFYLIIIFRRTSSVNNFSPAVEEFTLATGSRGDN